MSGAEFLETIGRDALFALRTMRKQPAFAATAVLTLALAIGGNTVMFTVIRAVLLKPLQYRDPDRLVHICCGATPSRFAEMNAAAQSFTGLGAYTFQENLTFSGAAEPEVLKSVRVSASFLPILGVNPMLGRGFLPEEDSAGGTPVVMISAELWQRRFASDPQIVGKLATIAMSGARADRQGGDICRDEGRRRKTDGVNQRGVGVRRETF